MTYAIINGTTTIVDVMAYSNTVTMGWFWTLMLIAVWTTGFLSMKSGGRFTLSQALASSSFLTFLGGMFMWVLGLIGTPVFMVAAVMMIGTALLLFTEER